MEIIAPCRYDPFISRFVERIIKGVELFRHCLVSNCLAIGQHRMYAGFDVTLQPVRRDVDFFQKLFSLCALDHFISISM